MELLLPLSISDNALFKINSGDSSTFSFEGLHYEKKRSSGKHKQMLSQLIKVLNIAVGIYGLEYLGY